MFPANTPLLRLVLRTQPRPVIGFGVRVECAPKG
jgi:hypothetical protein